MTFTTSDTCFTQRLLSSLVMSVSEWSKSDTERQIYGIAYMWNLKNHKWTYLQNRCGVTGVKKKKTYGYQGIRGV